MTGVAAPAKVLVTGSNGFIAVWIVQNLVQQGYSVRGTVRSADKGEFLVKQFGDKFEYVLVPDIIKDGAFDEAVQGVDAVLHTAAPVTFSGTYDSVVSTAVDSTVGVLNSILRKGQSVRRVVATSSFVSLMEPHDPGYSYTEADWNDWAIKEADEKRDGTPGYILYYAAKTAAERAAWDFVAQHKKGINWDLVTILPPYVFGPTIHDPASQATHTNGFSSTSWLYDNLFTERTAEEAVAQDGPYVDVRDVARAHVLALQKEKAGGERLTVAGGYFSWQDILDILSKVSPPLADIPKGHHGTKHAAFVGPDTSKAARILGLKDYINLEQSSRETVLSVRQH